jgi:hypothetical protein
MLSNFPLTGTAALTGAVARPVAGYDHRSRVVSGVPHYAGWMMHNTDLSWSTKEKVMTLSRSVSCILAFLGIVLCPAAWATGDSVLIDPGDVVINEFAASNTLILDPAGEAEDWIEFYNNLSITVSLDSMYLADDPSEPDKW